jgi:SWI/SNF-related matrix-associated actin-dependent regulator 1 of chromatin subfamily A
MKPQRLKGMTWGLPVENLWDDATANKLTHIPGLRVDMTKGRVEGYPDAVAVAAKRLGAMPTRPLEPALNPSEDPKLRPYQRMGIRQMAGIMQQMGGCLLADDMGLGKTVQAIKVAKVLVPDGRVMVVVPGSVRETWRDDLTKWGETDFAIVTPLATKADKAEWEKARTSRWVVCSYELADRTWDHAFGDAPADVLIVDEMHMVKGRSRGSKRTQRADALETAAMQVQYKLGMTGTPIWDRPRDLWRQLRILFGSTFGSSWDFDHAYCGAFLDDHGALNNSGATRGDELKLRLSYYMVRREKKDVLKDLPPLTRQVIWVDPTTFAKSRFIAFQMSMAGASIHDAIESTLNGKMETVFELAKQLKKFVVFTWMKKHAREMAKVLTEQHDTPCVAITGDMTVAQRSQMIKVAIENGWGVVATIDSVGTGVDILKRVSSTAIVHAIDFVPQKMAQAEARLHRIGQENNVHIIYVAMKESIDTILVNTVVQKLDAVISVMGKASQGLRDELAANEGGAGAEAAEQAALRAIYQEIAHE